MIFRKLNIKLILCALNILFGNILMAQCGINNTFLIPDATTTQHFIEVAGAANNDLSSTQQGICRVNLSFTHPHVGDLSIRLISPGGQSVVLVGNVGNSYNTSGSLWNIHFVPQSSPSAPDIGIFPVWANTSNWQAGTNYTGTYYPVAGNQLEQINSGPVNGLWIVELTDGSMLDEGKLISFSIEFCDPAGIQCSSCYKSAGIFAISNITACEGSDDLKPTIGIDYPLGPNDGNTSYRFLIATSDDKIIAVQTTPDLRTFPPGNYTMCGIAYESGNDQYLPTPGTGELLSSWKTKFYNGLAPFCGDMTLSCITIKIKPNSPQKQYTKYICGNGPIYIENQTITAPGVYAYHYPNSLGCDSTLTYTVLPIIFNTSLTVSNVLTCTNNKATLRPTGSLPPLTFYKWFDAFGDIQGGVDFDSLVVTTPGTYFLALEKDGCKDTFSIKVNSDISIPQITIPSVHLDCNKPTALLNNTAIPPNVSYQWTGPGGFSSTASTPMVTSPGIYTVTITKADGCQNVQSVIVTGDFAAPSFNFILPAKTCSNETISIGIQTQSNIVSQQWVLPDGSSQSGATITTDQNGKIYCTITAQNGCIKKDSALISFLTQTPQLIVRDTFINCTNPSVQLPVSTPLMNFTIAWTGPNGFTSDKLSPVVDVGGIYTAIATAPNNCTATVSVKVSADFTPPVLNIIKPNFGCKNDSLKVTTTFNPSNSSFQWTGPKQFRSVSSSPYIYETGWYYVTITAPNGCTKEDSLFANILKTNPEIVVKDDTITCVRDSAQLFVQVIKPSTTSILWSGPNGFQSNDTSPWVHQSGKYWIKVTDKSTGCFTKKSIIIHDITQKPKAVITQDSINCIQNEAIVRLKPNLAYDSFYWLTPVGDTLKNTHQFNTILTDTFHLHIVDQFGCKLDTFAHVTPDTVRPVISVKGNYISCSTPSTTLSATSSVPIKSIEWTFPDGTIHTEAKPTTSAFGQYNLKITGPNGCPASLTFKVVSDTVKPDLKVIGGSFTCKDKTFTLSYNTSIPNGKIQWSGPGNFSSTLDAPAVSVSGFYRLKLTSQNGCIAIDSALVLLSDILPSLTLKDDTISCKNNPVIIQPVSDAIGAEYLWTDPSGNTQTSETIKAASSGNYILQIKDKNECIVIDTALISIDTIKPASILASDYFISCNNDSLQIRPSSSTTVEATNWYLDQQLVSNDSIFTLTGAGNYRVTIAGRNGCVTEELFTVHADKDKPDFTATGGEINCNFTKITLKASSTTPGATFEWDVDGNILNDSTITVIKVGAYPLRVIGLNGCIADTTITVDTNYKVPDVIVSDGSISCDSSNYLLRAISTTPGNTYGWFGPNSFFSDQPNVYAVDTGTYYIFVTGANGCLHVASVYVDDDPPYPSLTLSTDTITCFTPEVGIDLTSPDDIEKYKWTGPNAFTSTVPGPIVNNAGIYRVQISNEYGCITTDSITVPIDTLSPAVSISYRDSILCEHREINLYGNQPPTGEHYQYQWTTTDGVILTNPSDSAVLIQNPGNYTLSIINDRNGCQAYRTSYIEEKNNPIKSLDVRVEDAECEGINNGEIFVNGGTGAQGSITSNLYGDYFTNYNYFNKLSPGTYYIKIKDSYGCIFGDSVRVGINDPIKVDLGNDTIIRLGEKVLIDAVLNIDPDRILSVQWSSESSTCSGCTEFEDSPLISTLYSVKVTTLGGCIAEDEKVVIVESRNLIFVPNIFTPNGDGRNDLLEYSSAPGISIIDRISVYDRWGNVLFSRHNLTPGDPAGYWDGSFNGSPVNPGVFVYLLEYTLVTGEKLTVKGGVTLLR